MIQRRYPLFLVIGICLWLVLFFGITWFIDPYGVSPVNLSIEGFNRIKPKRLDIDRLIKPYEVWRYQPRTIFIGTSRIHQSLNPRVLDNTMFAPAYNASIPAAELSENLSDIKQYIKINKKLRVIIMELFFYNFTRPQIELREKGFMDLIANSISLQFGASVFYDGVLTSQYNLLGREEGAYIHRDGYWVRPEGFNTKAAFNSDLYVNSVILIHKNISSMIVQPTAVDTLKHIVEICAENQIKLILVIGPAYPWDDYRLYSLGYWDVLEEWYRTISKFDVVYDFSKYNDFTKERVSKKMIYWNDPLHFSMNMGDRMLDALANNKGGETFGTEIDIDRVEKVLDLKFKGLKEWIAENSEFVESFEKGKIRSEQRKRQEFVNSFLDLNDRKLTLQGRSYPIVKRLAGSVEYAGMDKTGYFIGGWAVDIKANKPVFAVVATIGNTVVGMEKPSIVREDIAQGVASGAALAGFSMTLPVDFKENGIAELVRLFGLTEDGVAVQLASNLAATHGVPFENHSFTGSQ